jgi:hypothetical protein
MSNPYACHIDLEEGIAPDACVLDTGRPEDCVYARKYGDNAREHCGEWKPIKLNHKQPPYAQAEQPAKQKPVQGSAAARPAEGTESPVSNQPSQEGRAGCVAADPAKREPDPAAFEAWRTECMRLADKYALEVAACPSMPTPVERKLATTKIERARAALEAKLGERP